MPDKPIEATPIDSQILDAMPSSMRFVKGHPYNLYGLIAWLRKEFSNDR